MLKLHKARANTRAAHEIRAAKFMSAISTLLYALVVVVDTQLLNEVLDLVRNVDNDALLQQLKQDLKYNYATTNESQAQAKQLFQRATAALGNGTAHGPFGTKSAALRAVMRFDERARKIMCSAATIGAVGAEHSGSNRGGGAVADASQHGIHTAGAQAIDRMPLVLSATGRWALSANCRPPVGGAFDGALLAQSSSMGAYAHVGFRDV